MYAEIFEGIDRDPHEVVTVVKGADHDEMIMVRDIPLYSTCEHHLLPFIGRANVAYIPNRDGRITGLSKIARVVDLLSKRPQVQERLTTLIADTLMEALGRFQNGQKKFANLQRLEGKITHFHYTNPPNRSTLEILRSYQNALQQAGFQVVTTPCASIEMMQSSATSSIAAFRASLRSTICCA